MTYRCAPHGTADDPSAYIDAVRVEEERRNECVGRFERYLRRRGLLTDELVAQTRDEALNVMREAIAAAEAEPAPDPDEVFEHAYADPPPGCEMAERTIREPVNDCLHVELARDEDVMVMGEDVGRAGGVFRATAGLRSVRP